VTVCHSERFIVGPDAPVVQNLAALWIVQPELAEQVDALPADPSMVIAPAKDGASTLALAGANGKTVQLHSRYQPLAEADRWAESVKLEKVSVVFLLGLGLGHHLKALYDRAGESVRFTVFEPNLSVRWSRWICQNSSPRRACGSCAKSIARS
jgi:hypothetical protein